MAIELNIERAALAIAAQRNLKKAKENLEKIKPKQVIIPGCKHNTVYLVNPKKEVSSVINAHQRRANNYKSL